MRGWARGCAWVAEVAVRGRGMYRRHEREREKATTLSPYYERGVCLPRFVNINRAHDEHVEHGEHDEHDKHDERCK